ncbi:MAG: hypothetical protein HY063_01810 [Bacteroidetes bacterium]|nr:hypothetical protein [Bacteroidota bacterium]
MNIQAEKLALVKSLLEIKSEALLRQMKAILQGSKTDLWDELSEEQKASVKRARRQLAQGEGKPHKEVMKKYAKWLTK